MRIDEIAGDASKALHEASERVEPPEITAVRRARARRSGIGIALAGFTATVAVVGGLALFGPGKGPDVAGTTIPAPSSAAPSDSTVPDTSPTTGPPTSAPSTTGSILAGNVFVLDDGSGPEICSAVAESLPPQCSGPSLDGLAWTDVPWSETAQGTTWADMYVEVRFLDGRFVLASPPQERRPAQRSGFDFTPPCDPPEGGWVFTPGPGATDGDLEAALAYIQAQPDYAAAWVYNLTDPPSEFTFAYVLVAAFTGDIARHEDAITGYWTGPLCVVERSHAESELRAIQDELAALAAGEWPDGLGYPTSFSVDLTTGAVEVGALFATESGRAWLDERFGPGLVRVTSQLAPLTPAN